MPKTTVMRPFPRPSHNLGGHPRPTRFGDIHRRAGSWRIGERLARTLTSEVFACSSRDGQTGVAKRLLPQAKKARPDLLNHERRCLLRFAGSSVVAVLDQWGEWLVLEALPHGDLRALAGAPAIHWLPLLPGPFGWLARLHDDGFAHGDLKLSHLMLRNPEHACVIDLATVTPSGSKSLSRATSLALPEGPGVATIAADVFAVGVMLHELLTGTLPSGTVRGPFRRQCGDLVDLSRRCRAENPEDRPSMHAVVTAVTRPRTHLDIQPVAAL